MDSPGPNRQEGEVLQTSSLRPRGSGSAPDRGRPQVQAPYRGHTRCIKAVDRLDGAELLESNDLLSLAVCVCARVRVCACVVCAFARVRMCGVRVCACACGCLAIVCTTDWIL